MSASLNDSRSQDHGGRVYGLDVFRAFAILFVLIGHSLEHSIVPESIKTLGHLGVLGVELFFVLSGFLIGSIIMRLIDRGMFFSISDIAGFWKRRWFRTLPLYFVVLLAFIRFDYHGRHGIFDYPQYFLFLQNFAYGIPEFFELSWSLAIEEHFYLWFPLVFLIWNCVTKKSHFSIVLTAFSFICVSYIFRIAQPLFVDWDDFNRAVRLTVLSRLDAIMFGLVMAAIKYYRNSVYVWLRSVTPVTAFLFVLLCAWWFANAPFLMSSRSAQLNLFTVQAILCALLLPWFDNLRAKDGAGRFFTLTSQLSYSLYLVHILVIIFVNRFLLKIGVFESFYNNPFVIYPVYFSGFYFVSWVTYNGIEKPFLRLRDLPLGWREILSASWFAVGCCVILIFVF